MIIEAIINAIAAVVNPIIELLPVWTPLDLSGALAPALHPTDGDPLWMSGLAYADRYFPVTEAVIVIGLSASLWVSTVGFKVALWIAKVFHISGND